MSNWPTCTLPDGEEAWVLAFFDHKGEPTTNVTRAVKGLAMGKVTRQVTEFYCDRSSITVNHVESIPDWTDDPTKH
jgi:hypothetical protein